MKKIGIIKIGRNAIEDSNTLANSEVFSIKKLLDDAGFETKVFTQFIKTLAPKKFYIELKEGVANDVGDFDALVIINGSVGFFGGVDGFNDFTKFEIMANFEKPIFYINTDPSLLFSYAHNAMVGRSKTKEIYKKYDGLISVNKQNIVYITQCKDTDKIKALEPEVREVEFSNILDKQPLYTMTADKFNRNYKYDFIYAGAFRGGRRRDDMVKYYFHEKCRLIGLKYEDFDRNKNNKELLKNAPSFERTIRFTNLKKFVREGAATVSIGDLQGHVAMDCNAFRTYETILYGLITFVDSKYDRNRRLFKDANLNDYMYVNSYEEALSKLNSLSMDEKASLVEDLQQDIVINFEYKKELESLKEIICKYI